MSYDSVELKNAAFAVLEDDVVEKLVFKKNNNDLLEIGLDFVKKSLFPVSEIITSDFGPKITYPSRAPWQEATYGSGPQADSTYNHAVVRGFNSRIFMPDTAGVVGGNPAWFEGNEDGFLSSGVQLAEKYLAFIKASEVDAALADPEYIPTWLRPFYVAVKHNGTSASVRIDIGSDGTGAFTVDQGSFQQIFTVTKDIVTFKPSNAGNAFFILDAPGVYSPYFQFRHNGAVGFSLQGVAPTVLAIINKDGANHIIYTSGASATAAVTEFVSSVKIDGNVGFYNTAPVAKQTGVAVTAAAIHAALVNVGLIAA